MSNGFKNDNTTGRSTHQDVPLENIVVYNPTGTNIRNTYTSLAAAVVALMDVKGEKILRIMGGDATWPVVSAMDCRGLHIIGDGTSDLTIPDGVSWTYVPASIKGFASLIFQGLTATYSGNGSDFDLDLDVGVVGTSVGAAVPFVINDGTFTYQAIVRMRSYTYINGNSGTKVFRLENGANLSMYMYDQAVINGSGSFWPFEDDGSFTTTLSFDVFGACVTLTDVDPYGVYAPTGPGRVGNFGLANTDGLVLLADDTPGNSIDSISGGYVASGDAAWLVGYWTHPIIQMGIQHARGSIMPLGISGNDLVVDGYLSQGLTKGTVTTAVNTSINKVEGVMTTAAAIGAEEGWITSLVASRRIYARAIIGFRLPALTGYRIFVGFTDTTRANSTATDNPAGGNMVGLQFSPSSRGDTTLQFVAQAAGSQTLVPIVSAAGGTPSTTLSYTLEIVLRDGTTPGSELCFVRLYSTNTSLSERGAWKFVGSQLPTRDVQMAMVASVTSVDGSAYSFGTTFAQIATGVR